MDDSDLQKKLNIANSGNQSAVERSTATAGDQGENQQKDEAQRVQPTIEVLDSTQSGSGMQKQRQEHRLISEGRDVTDDLREQQETNELKVPNSGQKNSTGAGVRENGSVSPQRVRSGAVRSSKIEKNPAADQEQLGTIRASEISTLADCGLQRESVPANNSSNLIKQAQQDSKMAGDKNKFEFPPHNRADLDRGVAKPSDAGAQPQEQSGTSMGVSQSVSQKQGSNLEKGPAKRKHKQTDASIVMSKSKPHLQATDGLLFDTNTEEKEALRQGTPQLPRKVVDKKKSAAAVDSRANNESSIDALNASHTKDKINKSQSKKKSSAQEPGSGQAKKRIGLLMKESHSIFKLDEKQKALMHQMKQEDQSQKLASKEQKQTNKEKDLQLLMGKQGRFQANILKDPAERQKIMEQDQAFQQKKEKEKLDSSRRKNKRSDLGAPSVEYLEDDTEMHFTDPDDEDRSRNKQSIFDKFKRKNSAAGGNSMPVATRISELSNMADLSQEDVANMSADRRGKQRLVESSGMASSYTHGQTSQGLDGTDPDSTFNVTRESNESTTQKKRKGKFSFNPFKRKSKVPETSSDPKAGISEDSTVGGDRSCSDEQSDRKKTALLQNGLLVQNVPYDKEMQESVDQYSMIRGADTFNDEMGDDTVKSFADGGVEKRVKFNEVPESTRATECQDRAVNMPLSKKTGNYTKIINQPEKDFEQWHQNDFLNSMDELTGQRDRQPQSQSTNNRRQSRAYATNQGPEYYEDIGDDCETGSMYSTYSKYERVMGSFAAGRPTTKSMRQTRPTVPSEMQNVESMFHDTYHNTTIAETDMKYILEVSNVLQERIQNKDKKNITAVEKMVYSKDKLLFLITKRLLITHEIQQGRRDFYASAVAKDPACVRKFEEQIDQLIEKKKSLFNMTKLRRTVIYGIPCDFVKFDDACKDITEEHLNEKNNKEAGENSAAETNNSEATGKTASGVLEDLSKVSDDISAYAEEIRESINMRAEIWSVMCNIDGLKEELLQEYEQERQRREKRRQDPSDDSSYELSVISQWCNQFVDDEEDKYNEEHGGLDLDAFVKEMKQPLTRIVDPEKLYLFYKCHHTPRIKYDIGKDLHRTDTNNADLKNTDSEASRALYNVLNAYSHLDRNVGYVQSMNFITAWILKFTRTKKRRPDGSYRLQYNEAEAFYILVHIMRRLEWREIFKPGMERLMRHLKILEELLSTTYVPLFEHILEETEDTSLFPVFGSLILSIFISDLQAKFPKILIHIFDAFLIDGEEVIFTLLLKILDTQQDTILGLRDMDLIEFMKKNMHQQCLKDNEMYQLLDFEETCDGF